MQHVKARVLGLQTQRLKKKGQDLSWDIDAWSSGQANHKPSCSPHQLPQYAQTRSAGWHRWGSAPLGSVDEAIQNIGGRRGHAPANTRQCAAFPQGCKRHWEVPKESWCQLGPPAPFSGSQASSMWGIVPVGVLSSWSSAVSCVIFTDRTPLVLDWCLFWEGSLALLSFLKIPCLLNLVYLFLLKILTLSLWKNILWGKLLIQ